jgi:hypothetical protein
MSKVIHLEATGDVDATAADVYRLIADYQDGHTRIIPPEYFRNLKVLKGGYGEGTEIAFEMIAFGNAYTVSGRVTEPEPGRVLVETYPKTGVVTKFIVEPTSASTSRVTISTDMPSRGGIAGWLERMVTPRYLRKVYAEELARINEQV